MTEYKLNIFVLSNLAEYEYRIYSKQEIWIFVFEYVIFGGYYSNIRIYLCYTETDETGKTEGDWGNEKSWAELADDYLDRH